MLDIKNKQSTNEFYITGVLNEIEIKEGTSSKTKDDYISCNVSVRVDQEVDGKPTENIIPITLFSNRHKKDGELNSNYDRIKKYGETLISVGSADSNHQASKVNIAAEIRENSFANRDGKVINSWRLSTNFINGWRAQDEEGTAFKVTGVVVKKIPELNKEGDETGRLIIKLCIVGFGGKANVIDFYAAGNAATYIDRNWNQGDTVLAAGIIAFTSKIVEVEEEVGFGELKNKRTESRRELIITSGSSGSLAEKDCYDADDIKLALDKRKADLAALLENTQKSASKPAGDGFGF